MPILQIDERTMITILSIANERNEGISPRKFEQLITRAQAGDWGLVLDDAACLCTNATTFGDHHQPRCPMFRRRYADMKDATKPARTDQCIEEINDEWFVNVDSSSINEPITYRSGTIINSGVHGPFRTEHKAQRWLEGYNNQEN